MGWKGRHDYKDGKRVEKKTRRRLFCPESFKQKFVFETKEKALDYIRFNGEEIEKANGYKPVRAYWCNACGGWHVTSRPSTSHVEKKDNEAISLNIKGTIELPENNTYVPLCERKPLENKFFRVHTENIRGIGKVVEVDGKKHTMIISSKSHPYKKQKLTYAMLNDEEMATPMTKEEYAEGISNIIQGLEETIVNLKALVSDDEELTQQ